MIKDLQVGILESIFSLEDIQSPPLVASTFFDKIQEYDAAHIKAALGDFFGNNLLDFVETIDKNHPGVLDVASGFFQEENETANSILQFIKLIKYSVQENLNDIIPGLSKSFLNKLPKETKLIGPGIQNNQYIRLIKKGFDRECVRAVKQVKSVILPAKIGVLWEKVGTCETYFRNSKVKLEEVAKAEKKAQRFKDLGCMDLAREIQKDIDAFKEQLDNTYFGFHRLRLLNAAVVIAKSCDFKLNAANKDVQKIEVDVEWLKDRWSYFKNRSQLHLEVNCEDLTFEPKVFPIAKLEFADALAGRESIPSKIKDVVNYLEEFPPLNGKPAFDNYFVVVPSVKFEKTPIDYEKIQDFALAMATIKENNSILLGEKDGKCYFICYFI